MKLKITRVHELRRFAQRTLYIIDCSRAVKMWTGVSLVGNDAFVPGVVAITQLSGKVDLRGFINNRLDYNIMWIITIMKS